MNIGQMESIEKIEKIEWFFRRSGMLALMLASTLLAGCLGGQGSGSTTPGTGAGTPSSPTATTRPTVLLALQESQAATANRVTAVSFGSPIWAVATVKDAKGAAVASAVVSFASASPMIVFNPATATALTGSDGRAWIRLDTSGIADAGATSLTASADVETTSNGTATTATYTSAPLGVAVNASSVTLGAATLDLGKISAYGTALVSVPVLVNGAPSSSPMAVSFTSPCVASGKATLSSPVTTINGVATATYKDANCATGSDVISASVGDVSTRTTLVVTPPATSNLQFTSAVPAVIGIQGTGSLLQQNSTVSFKVVDASNNGKPGVTVNFSLLQTPRSGGATLATTSATSDADGNVTATVKAGSVPMPVSVVASVTLADGGTSSTSSTQSNVLTVTTGIPSQDFFSLSVQTHNIEGLSYDGITSNLTVIASDRVGNPVPDGTVMNFITEGSQIVPSSCRIADGTCTVTFKSAQFKPVDGRVTVLAYASGEKSFIDLNGNNVYDAGETFYDLGDPYIDASENGQWDAANAREQTLNFAPVASPVACLVRLGDGSTGSLPQNYSNVPSVQGTCSGAWNGGRTYVRRSALLVLSGSVPAVTQASYRMGNRCANTFTYTLNDWNGNAMPAGTTIAVGTLNTVSFQTTDAQGIVITSKATISLSQTAVPDSIGPTSIVIAVDGGTSCVEPIAATGAWQTGDFALLIKTPQGVETPVSVHIDP